MIKSILLSVLTFLLFIQCAEEKDPFLISNNNVGNLIIGMKIKQVDSLFASDSIVKVIPTLKELPTQGEVEIYEKAEKN